MVLTDKKSHNIQVLRGLAIIAVVFIHNTPDGLSQVLFRPIVNFSVGMFLFLSGMLSSADKWNPLKRIRKIVVPYLIWSMLYVILNNQLNNVSFLIVYLKQIFIGGAAAIMYYVFVYCEFTLLIPLIDKLASSKYKLIGFIITPLEIITMRLIPLILGYEINNYVSVIMGLSCIGWFTYFYLGYLLGNDYISIKISTKRVCVLYAFAIILQIAEGYWYYSMGDPNCGTQLKLSSILTGVLFIILAFRYVNSDNDYQYKWVSLLGNESFGIYFSHLAIMNVLNRLPYYSVQIHFPINAILAIIISYCCVLLGKKVFGKYACYLAF